MNLRTRKRAGTLALAFAVAGSLLAPTPAFAADPVEVLDTPLTLDYGHIDAFNPVLNADDSIQLALKEDVTGSHVLHTPESVTLAVKEAAKIDFPAGAPKPTGMPDEVYYLPLTQDADLIWPGWDTQAITPAFPGANTDIVVSAVDGPGQVFVWSTGSFGALKSLMKDGTSYALPNTISQPYPAHTHANWAFTEAGTYRLTVRADVVASDGKTGSSQTATYTFVVGDQPAPEQQLEITGLSEHYHQNTQIVLGAAADPAVENAVYEWSLQRKDQAEAQVVADQTGAEFRITAEQVLDGAKVSARVLDADGRELAAAEPVTIEVNDHGAAPLQKVTVSGAADHYHTGGTANLTASVSPASVLSNWVWEVKPTGATEWTAVDGQSAAAYSFAVTEDLDGAFVRARLAYDDGSQAYGPSEPVTIEIDDHHGEEPVETALSITGLAGPYHTGDVANLTAVQDPATDLDHYHWFIKRAGDADYSVISGQSTANLAYTVAEGDADAQIIVRLYDHDHNVVAESAPATVEIDDHHGEDPAPTIAIQGLEASYRPGDTVTLGVLQTPDTGNQHYHWYIKRSGDEDYSALRGRTEMSYEVTAEDQGAQIIVRLFGDEHAVVAESAPVTLVVEQDAPVTPKPSSPPVEPAETALDGIPAGGIGLDKSSVEQGGTVTIQVGEGTDQAGQWVAAWMFSEPVLLGGDWQQVAANGTIAVRIPADAATGARRIAVFDAVGALVGYQSIQVTAASGSGSNSDEPGTTPANPGATTPGAKQLTQTGSDLPLYATGTAALLLLAGAALMIARRRSAEG